MYGIFSWYVAKLKASLVNIDNLIAKMSENDDKNENTVEVVDEEEALVQPVLLQISSDVVSFKQSLWSKDDRDVSKVRGRYPSQIHTTHNSVESSVSTYGLECPVFVHVNYLNALRLVGLSEKATAGEPFNESRKPDQPLNGESLSSVWRVKGRLFETLIFLDIYESYLQWPSEETYKQMKLLFDRGKNTFHNNEIESFKYSFRNSYLAVTGYENAKYQNFEHHKISKANITDCTLDCGHQPRSISENALQSSENQKSVPKNFEEDSTTLLEILKQGNNSLKIQLREKDVVLESLNSRVKELEERNSLLEKQMQDLKTENYELFNELGKISVEKKTKVNEERKSKFFQTPSFTPSYKSFIENPDLLKTLTAENVQRGYPKDQYINCPEGTKSRLTSCDTPSNFKSLQSSTAEGSSHQTSLQERETSGEKKVHHSEEVKEKNETSKEENGEASSSTQSSSNSASFQTEGRTSGEEKTRHSEEVNGNNQTSKEETGEATKTSTNGPSNSASFQTEGRTSDKEKTRHSGKVTRNNQTSKDEKGEASSSTQSPSNSASFQQEETSGGDETHHSENEGVTRNNETSEVVENLSFSVQQEESNGREYISLGSVPSTSVATTLYNNYKLLLLTMGQRLLLDEVEKMKIWANHEFSINNSQNATEVLFRLDDQGIINAANLSQLRVFFESILRIDLVHIIDAFLLGDYSLLRHIPTTKNQQAKRSSQNLSLNPGRPQDSSSSSLFQSSVTTGSDVIGAGKVTLQDRSHRISHEVQQPSFSSSFSKRSPKENQLTTKNTSTEITPSKTSTVVVNDGPRMPERLTTSNNTSSITNEHRNAQTRQITNFNVSNGSKLSKFQRPDAPSGNRSQTPARDGTWLCSHYKRHCYVKFECCDSFWPCHRCHNNQSKCGKKKLKSRDTKMVKCVNCNKVQQFAEFCCDCNTKFASYYCGLCKHLTGTDDHPYHCSKCRICRIHGDRSFHCDTCGVCLDVQLRGNHKCREGSAHDECCICLEDAFTGCQILPCSHKVHKECATQMIRNGITRCPICRESFAHKLERRHLNPRKRK